MNEEDDRVVWKGDGEGRFSVKAFTLFRNQIVSSLFL